MICKQYDLCKKRVYKRVDLTIVKKGEYSADVLSAPGCYARGQGIAAVGGRSDLQDIEQDQANGRGVLATRG